jgi:hypothetical protein
MSESPVPGSLQLDWLSDLVVDRAMAPETGVATRKRAAGQPAELLSGNLAVWASGLRVRSLWQRLGIRTEQRGATQVA